MIHFEEYLEYIIAPIMNIVSFLDVNSPSLQE